MLTDIIASLQNTLELKTNNERHYTRFEDYCVTIYPSGNKKHLFVEIATPGISDENNILVKDFFNTQFPDIRFEQNANVYQTQLTQEKAQSPEDVINFLRQITDFLKSASIAPDLCPVCNNANTDCNVFVNDSYMRAHDFCADRINRQLNGKYKGTTKSNALGLLTGMGFAIIASALWVVLTLFKIMPAISAVLIGIVAAIGFRLFNARPSSFSKVFFTLFFFVLCLCVNFIGDFYYAVHYHLGYDFVMTYTDWHNIFNTTFDVISGTVIAYFSMSIVYDFDRGWFRIKKVD